MRNGRSRRISRGFLARALTAAAAVGAASGLASAAIPEPDAVLWGEITTQYGFPLPDGSTVQAVRSSNGEVLATYLVDFSSAAQYAFVLRVPMADLTDGGSLPSGTAQRNEFVELRLVGEPNPLFVPQLVDRGHIEHFSYGQLVLTDTDGDKIPDMYETGTGVFTSIVDTGSDPSNPDSDGDGIDDGDEVLAGTNPNVAPGDVNADGKVDLGDAWVLELFLSGAVPSPTIDEEAADLAPLGAPDGVITIGDLFILRRLVNGEITIP